MQTHTRDLTATIQTFGMRGMTIESLQTMVKEHKPHASKSYVSACIVQATRAEIFVKRAIGAE